MEWRFAAEHIADLVWAYDVTEGHFRYVSPSVERMRGYTPAEALRQSMRWASPTPTAAST